jgi:RimJ/RimL family protein N-acetyltransferase
MILKKAPKKLTLDSFNLKTCCDQYWWNPASKLLENPKIMRWVLAGALSPEQAQNELQQWQKQWQKYGYGNYFVTDKQEKTLLGFIKIYNSPRSEFPQIGYAVDTPYQGRGLGTKFAETAQDIAFEILNQTQLSAYARVQNHPSRRILEKVGFRCDNDNLWFDNRDYCQYSLTQERYFQMLGIRQAS